MKMKMIIIKMKVNMKMKIMKIIMNINMKMNMKMKMKMMIEQWVKTKKNKIIKEKNDYLDKIIDKSKSFEEQIKSLKKREDLKRYWSYILDFNESELKDLV